MQYNHRSREKRGARERIRYHGRLRKIVPSSGSLQLLDHNRSFSYRSFAQALGLIAFIPRGRISLPLKGPARSRHCRLPPYLTTQGCRLPPYLTTQGQQLRLYYTTLQCSCAALFSSSLSLFRLFCYLMADSSSIAKGASVHDGPVSPTTSTLEPAIDRAAERRLVRKLDLRILPVLWILYLVNFIDR
jgi:hypothetical protein